MLNKTNNSSDCIVGPMFKVIVLSVIITSTWSVRTEEERPTCESGYELGAVGWL